MVEPLFYILGIALVLVALAISFIGMRSERFPGSRRLMGAVAAGTALLVVGVAVFGVLLAREEQQHRLEEQARAEEEAVEEEEAAPEPEAVEEPAEPDPEGRQLFVQTCNACHVLADAETTGTIGPNLDTEVPQAQDDQFVRETILDPPPGMAIPELPDEQVDAIAEYVASVAGR